MKLFLAPEFYDDDLRMKIENHAAISGNIDRGQKALLNASLLRSSVLKIETLISKFVEADEEELNLPSLNYYRHWQTNQIDHFISVDSGDWILLTTEEYEALVQYRIPPELAKKLEKNFILLTQNNITSYINKLRLKYGFLQEGPTLHIVVVTSNCNLKCVYCQASAPTSLKKDMDLAMAEHAVNRILESPSDSYIIEFQGGEPLLNFKTVKYIIDYSESLAKSRGKRIEYSLISNFTRSVTEEKLKYLITHNVSICFSLDGPADLHEANRGNGYPDAFIILLDNLKLYKKTWASLRNETAPLAALLTTTRSSLTEYKSIIDLYLELGFRKINLRPLTPLGSAIDNFHQISYTAEEFFQYWRQAIEYIVDLRIQRVDIVDFYLELMLTKLFGNESGFMDLRSPCGASYGQITYNYDGRIFSCDEGRMIKTDNFMIGRACGENLNNILLSPQAIVIANYSITEQYYCDYCAFKPFCGICPVLHNQQKGRMHMNVLESDHCKIMQYMYSYILEKYIYESKFRNVFNEILLNINWQKL